MALTTGFKRLIGLIVVGSVLGGGSYIADKKNYWGLLDEKPKAEKVEEATQQAQEPAPILVESPTRAPVQVQVQEEPAPQAEPSPINHDAAINKLKGLGKL